MTERPNASSTAAEFDRLLREHVPALYQHACRWTGAADRAEDLVQELLVRLYPRLEELRGLDQVRPWALRVMYRIFVDELRRTRRSPVQYGLEAPAADAVEDDGGELADEALQPWEAVERQLTEERLSAAWSRLGADHRVVLSMHDIEGYSLAEVAQLTDTPVGTLKSRLHRARARLRALLAEDRIEAPGRVWE